MSYKSNISAYIQAYLLWLVSFLLGALLLYRLRETLLMGMVVAGSNSQQLTESELFYSSLRARAADQWLLFAAGFVLIVLIVWFEHFYRTAVPIRRLWPRFFLITAIEVGVIFLADALTAALQNSLGVSAAGYITLLFSEIVIALAMLALWLRSRTDADANPATG